MIYFVLVRLNLEVADIKGFCLCEFDVKLAYHHLDKPLVRKKSITFPALEFQVSYIFNLSWKKALFGSSYTSGLWIWILLLLLLFYIISGIE